MTAKHGLGRGLDALISEGKSSPARPDETGFVAVSIREIAVNTLQPRHDFDSGALDELVLSIRKHGVLQPLVVRRKGNGYELIAGERRLRASELAGIKEVPVIVKDADDQASLEMALVENLQREDLNSIEEAEGYKMLADRFGMTQEEISEKVGKGRATVANSIRLLSLPPDIKELIRSGALSDGHAKVLLGIEIDEEKSLLARRVVSEGLSVRALEKLTARGRGRKLRKTGAGSDIPPEHIQYLSDKLHHLFGTSVRIIPCKTLMNGNKRKGRVEVDFFSNDDLSRVLDLLGVTE